MTSGFYEQLGVETEANATQLRAAYGRAVAKLVRRRKQIIEQGGDPAQIDESRSQLDEAWAVLADPVRRRRYDAMIRWTSGNFTPDAETLWAEVGDSLVHPAAALAAKLLRVTTHLQQIGQMPIAPSSSEDDPPTLVPADEDLTAPRVPPRKLAVADADRTAHARPDRLGKPGASVVPLVRAATPQPTPDYAPTARPVQPVTPEPAAPGNRQVESGLRVVDGSPTAPPVLVMPLPAARPRTLGPDEITALVDTHGYSGALLRDVREARGLPLQELADTTRISVRYLEAIEADRFTDLPSATFVRGYVREMARILGLDPEATVAGYMRRLGG